MSLPPKFETGLHKILVPHNQENPKFKASSSSTIYTNPFVQSSEEDSSDSSESFGSPKLVVNSLATFEKLFDLDKEARKLNPTLGPRTYKIVMEGGDPEEQVIEQKPIRDCALPTLSTHSRCIVLPPCASSFEIKPSFLQTLPTYYGLPNNDPYHHLSEFEDACANIKLNGMTEDSLKLRLFPCSLKEKAKMWLNKLPSNSIRSWEDMQRKFIMKYFPPQKANARRTELMTFKEEHDELFHETWERFKDLELGCPNHGQSQDMLMSLFYQGLTSETRRKVDNASNGDFMDLVEDEAHNVLEKLAERSQLWDNNPQGRKPSTSHVSLREATQPKTGGMYEVRASSLDVHQEFKRLEDSLNKKFDMLLKQGKQGGREQVNEIQGPQVCLICEGVNHDTLSCPHGDCFPEIIEECKQMAYSRPKNDPYSNTYNPGWRNHPNFSWGGNQGVNYNQGGGNYGGASGSQGFQGFKGASAGTYGGNTYPKQPYQARPPLQAPNALLPPPQVEAPKSSIEEMLAKVLANQNELIQSVRNEVASTTQGLHKLEAQMGQLASEMRERKQGELPSMTEKNPRINQAKAITTLRSGRTYDNKVAPSNGNEEIDTPKEPLLTSKVPKVPPGFQMKTKGDLGDDGVILGYSDEYLMSKDKSKIASEIGGASGSKPSVDDMQEEVALPFPQAVHQEKELSKKEKKSMECFDVFKKVEVNIPLLDAIKTIPTYAKFLKDLCTHKRYKSKLKKDDKVCLNERISAVLQRKLPPKLKDPGSITIPCKIGEKPFEKVLMDLGASINLMPYGVYKELGLSDLKPIQISLQLADRSVRYPRGVVEDVLVQVDELVIPADFVILDMEEVYQDDLPIIFGRAFMATAGTKIDVKLGLLTMTVYDTTIGFKIFDELRKPMRLQKVYSIEVEDKINELVEHTFHETSSNDALESAIAHFGMDFCEEGTLEAVEHLDSYFDMPISTQVDGYYTMHEVNGVREVSNYLSITPTPPVVNSTPIDLKPLPSHLKYVYIDDAHTKPLIISSSLSQE